MTTKVIFEYDETSRKWEVKVEGVNNPIEAVEAFNAVLLTTYRAPIHMGHKAEQTQDDTYRIIVGI